MRRCRAVGVDYATDHAPTGHKEPISIERGGVSDLSGQPYLRGRVNKYLAWPPIQLPAAATRAAGRPVDTCHERLWRGREARRTNAPGGRQHLFVLTIMTPARIGPEKVWRQRRRGIGRHSNRCCADQNSVPDDARKPERVASKRDAGRCSPHEPKRLQDIMPQRHVRDVAQRAHLSVENEIPTRKDHLSHVFARIKCALMFWELSLSFAASWRQKRQPFAAAQAGTAARYDRTKRNSGQTRYPGWRENQQARTINGR